VRRGRPFSAGDGSIQWIDPSDERTAPKARGRKTLRVSLWKMEM
jgi:hypothetical protein